MGNPDTIAAIATPAGQGGIGIVRVSGPSAMAIGQALCGKLPLPRQAGLRKFFDHQQQLIDEGIVFYFPAPHSFTGEDIVELQGHGGPVVMDLLLTQVLRLGARPARPGEFSERAFLNNKLDLAQAEAVADLIACDTVQAVRAAVRSLQGAFSEQIYTLVEALIKLRMYVEAAIDFPEEEIDFLADGHVAQELENLRQRLADLRAKAVQGKLLRDGMTVVIAGQPNVGKSSLLNRLAGRETAIVTEIPGTTRDVLREHVNLDGMPLHVVDTAGLRDSSDLVEQEGIRRAWSEIQSADRILMVVDDRHGLTAKEYKLRSQLPAETGISLIYNKIDLTGRVPEIIESDWGPVIRVSAKMEMGLDLLRNHLKACMGFQGNSGGEFMARRRHLQALAKTDEALVNAVQQSAMGRAGELVAEELRQAQRALGEITGEFTSEDLLERIFANFCIGK